MKVYVAQFGVSCEGETPVGVFSTEELAWAYLEKSYSKGSDYVEVVEFEVDEGE